MRASECLLATGCVYTDNPSNERFSNRDLASRVTFEVSKLYESVMQKLFSGCLNRE